MQNMAKIAEPLYQLQRKNVPFIWTKERQQAFDTIKQLLTTTPVLAHPDFTKSFILHTDASINALGAVLAQLDDDGNERVIAYAYQTTNKHERNYTTTHQECLAVYWAIKHFQKYLFGKFIVVTDHSALKWLFNNEKLQRKFARWILELSEFDFTIKHCAGKKHQNANALSRLTVDYSQN